MAFMAFELARDRKERKEKKQNIAPHSVVQCVTNSFLPCAVCIISVVAVFFCTPFLSLLVSIKFSMRCSSSLAAYTHLQVKVFDRLLANNVGLCISFRSQITQFGDVLHFLYHRISYSAVCGWNNHTDPQVQCFTKRVSFHFSWVSSYLTASTATAIKAKMVVGGKSRFPS